MRQFRSVRALGVLAILVASLGVAPSPRPSAPVVVPLVTRNASGVKGRVILHPQGASTLIDVQFERVPLAPLRIVLHPGRDCDVTSAADRAMPLNMLGGNHSSQTLVAIPISSFGKSNFVVDVRDATERRAAAQACAHL